MVFYWARFANYTQLGILLSILTICWVIAEIPTGIFADRYGRKPAVIMGFLSLTLGGIFIAASQYLWWLAIGGLLENIGRAFISGALEALTFDNLAAKQKSSFFNQLITIRTQVGTAAYIGAVIIGGFAYQFYYRLPAILGVVPVAIALVASFWLTEKRHHVTLESTSFGADVKEVIDQLSSSQLLPFLIPILMIEIVSFVFDWGFSRPAMALGFGLDSRGQSVLYAIVAIIAAGITGFVPKLRHKITDFNGLHLLNLIMAGGFVASFFKLGLWGVIPMLMIEICWYLSEPWISIIVNHHIESRLRATTLSAIQFFAKIPYVIINFFLGEAVDGGTVAAFHVGVGLTMMAFLALNLVIFFSKIQHRYVAAVVE